MKKRSSIVMKSGVLFVVVAATAAVSGCAPRSASSVSATDGSVGSVGVALTLAPGVTVSTATYSISNPGGFSKAGSIDVSQSETLSTVIGGLPAGSGYAIEVDATTADGGTTCVGSASFSVNAHMSTAVSVHLTCHEGARTGSVSVNGTINICPVADGISANPADIAVGFPTALAVAAHDTDAGPSPLAYQGRRRPGPSAARPRRRPPSSAAHPAR